MNSIQDKLAKLPKWAQDYISLLEMRKNEAIKDRENVFSLANGGRTSSIRVSGCSSRPDIFLPNESTLVFMLEDGEEISVSFKFGAKDFDTSSVKIRSKWHQISIRPEAANVVDITSKGD